MEVINRKHEDIEMNKRGSAKAYINFNNGKTIIFSVKAVKSFGLSDALFLHVINDDDRWYIFFNSDEDGFRIYQRRDKSKIKPELYVFNSPLIKMFMKRSNRTEFPCKFPLTLTGAKHRGNELIEILINNEIKDYARQ